MQNTLISVVENPQSQMPARSRLDWFREVFQLDIRSLAVMRIGLGLMLLLLIGQIAWDAEAFLTDSGMLPRAARLELNTEENWTAPQTSCSVQMLSGELWFQRLILSVQLLAAAGLLIGFQTQSCLLVSWLLLVGMQARNPLMLIGADDLIRCMTFWSLFLPLGARWSWDAWSNARTDDTPDAESHGSTNQPGYQIPARAICSLATAAFIVQLTAMYLSTAVLKSHPVWTSEFTALYYALGSDHHTSALGLQLLNHPLLLKALTGGSLLLEFLGPAILFVPWKQGWIRLAVVLSFWLFHLGIAATMQVGFFPLSCLVFWSALLPAEFWAVLKAVPRELKRHLSHEVPTQKPELEHQVGWTADRLLPIGQLAWSTNLLVGALLCYVTLLNVVRLTPSIYLRLNPGPLQVLGQAAQLDQFWCMFAPRPFDFGGWYDVRGTLADGTQVNLWQTDLAPQQSRPSLVSACYENMRWRKVMVGMFEKHCPTQRRCMGEYLRDRWNRTHSVDQQLVAAEIVHMTEKILPPGPQFRKAAPEPERLWQWSRNDTTLAVNSTTSAGE